MYWHCVALLMYCTSASIVAVTGVIDDADSELLNFCDKTPLDISKMSKVSSTTNTVSKPVRASDTIDELRTNCKVA